MVNGCKTRMVNVALRGGSLRVPIRAIWPYSRSVPSR
jgi:hypothetical protein